MAREKVTRSSGNVFADIGLPDADEAALKSRLVMVISREIERRGLTQAAVASMLHTNQPEVSKLMNGRLDLFSLEKLIRFVRELGNDIEIKVRASPGRSVSTRVKGVRQEASNDNPAPGRILVTA